jgi:aminoglycoside phosphotransferase (APT) family kinase protein
MLGRIQEWLARAGFPVDAEVAPMTPGLGSTLLWRISGAGGTDYVLRVYPPGDGTWRDRETLAMRAASGAGLPVPDVLTTDAIDGRPAMLTTFAPGTTVAAAIGSEPQRAMETGRVLGTLLGEINRLPAPENLAPAEAWLDRAGPALAPLRARLAAMPNADRLLHLDYHPENVLMDGDGVTAVIDWTNTLPGPPHIDLGRSRAILQMVRTLPTMAPELASGVEAFEAGLVGGHAGIHGPDPEPDLSLAWGVGTQCVDFAPHVDVPGSWVTPELVAALEATRDRLIARVLDGAAA